MPAHLGEGGGRVQVTLLPKLVGLKPKTQTRPYYRGLFLVTTIVTNTPKTLF